MNLEEALQHVKKFRHKKPRYACKPFFMTESLYTKLFVMAFIVKNAVRELSVCARQFPEAMCDLTTLYIFHIWHNMKLKDLRWVCGKAEDKNHFWLQDIVENVYIDFTGHQFESIRPNVQILGQDIEVGTACEFERMGYVVDDSSETRESCYNVLKDSFDLIRSDATL